MGVAVSGERFDLLESRLNRVELLLYAALATNLADLAGVVA